MTMGKSVLLTSAYLVANPQATILLRTPALNNGSNVDPVVALLDGVVHPAGNGEAEA